MASSAGAWWFSAAPARSAAAPSSSFWIATRFLHWYRRPSSSFLQASFLDRIARISSRFSFLENVPRYFASSSVSSFKKTRARTRMLRDIRFTACNIIHNNATHLACRDRIESNAFPRRNPLRGFTCIQGFHIERSRWIIELFARSALQFRLSNLLFHRDDFTSMFMSSKKNYARHLSNVYEENANEKANKEIIYIRVARIV